MTDLLTYGGGIPRYLALWLPLTPVLVLVLRRLGIGATGVGVVLASTLPTFALHPPSGPGSDGLRLALVAAVVAAQAAWLVRTLRAAGRAGATPARSDRRVLIAAALVAVAVRAPLAWVDPGIGDFGTASDTAARHLLDGGNPYLAANPYATVGAYQYPAGTLLAHVPAAALLPREVAGEAWLSARATLWAVDAVAVVLLGAAGGPALAWTWALHPTLVRESAVVVANDVPLTLLAALAAVALARRRPLAAAVAVGLAVAIKPTALVLVPLLLAAAGPWPALLAGAVPAVLQLPFLLLPRPGLHGLAAIAEPAARADPGGALPLSAWRLLLSAPGQLRPAAVLGVAAAAAAAWAAGRALRRDHLDVARAGAAVALPLLVAFALATRWPTNFATWSLGPLLLAVAGGPGVRGAPRRVRRRTPGGSRTGRHALGEHGSQLAPRGPGAVGREHDLAG